jgi:hypothetical protein
VADAVVAGERRRPQHVLEAGELAGAPPHFDAFGPNHGHAGRVVAAVLELSQSLDEHGDDLLLTDIADDAAHVC